MLRSTLSLLSWKRRIKEDKKNSERLCAVAPHVMRVLFFLYASIQENYPLTPSLPSLGFNRFRKKRLLRRRKRPLRGRKGRTKNYTLTLTLSLLSLLSQLSLFFPTVGRLFLRGTSLFLPQHLSVLCSSTDSQSL